MPFPSRLGSDSAQSWTSDDTIRDAKPNGRSALGRLTPDRRGYVSTRLVTNTRYIEDSELSPRSRPPSRAPDGNNSHTHEVAPWDEPDQEPRDRAMSDPSSFEDFPEPRWGSIGSLSVDDNGNLASPSTFPSYLRGNSALTTPDGEERRPSMASASTISSENSGKPNVRSLNKIQSFFGDDPSESQENFGADQKTPEAKRSERPSYSRQISFSSAFRTEGKDKPSQSPGSVTPQPADSEVTPWDFQDPDAFQKFGETGGQQDSARVDKDRNRRTSTFPFHHPDKPHKAHKFSVHLHRGKTNEAHNGSSPSSRKDDDSFTLQKAETFSPGKEGRSATNLSSSKTSPVDGTDEHKPEGPHKRSLLDKIRGKHKDKDESAKTSPSPSDASLTLPKAPKDLRPPIKAHTMSIAEMGRSSTSTSRTSLSQSTPRKEHTRLPFGRSQTKRNNGSDAGSTKESPATPKQHPSLWNLDTDLSKMDGILGQPPLGSPPIPEATPTMRSNGNQDLDQDPFDNVGAWDAPDSWAVKRTLGDNASKLQEIDENSPLKPHDVPGKAHGIRIFKHDGTFNTLEISLNATSAEVVAAFAKKIKLNDDVNEYQIIMRQNNTSRQLEPGERPLALQKRMLEQAGYLDSDQLELIGREDHSYLCRFNFSHRKKVGYASLEKDPGFNKSQKLNNVDLAGYNLITIPVALYKKANEIIAINLSNNVAVDVPKDFIQGCSNLREIKFTSNEAARLPPSFALASRLTILDISNNRLEQLEHANLNKLENLIALSLANNKLSAIPSTFSTFKSLRKLVLSSNNLTEVPKCVSEIKTLTEVDVSFNQISSLSNIGRLSMLERLYATNNNLSGALEPSMSSLSRLFDLDIRFNAIESVDVCSRMPQLGLLSAGHNLITAFEGSLSRIRTLTLDHNPITQFNLEALAPNLSFLDLASAKLAQLSDDLFAKMPNVQVLRLDKNHFVSLSNHIGKLQKLERLSLAKNALASIPADIGRLTALRLLDVRENNINNLPPEIWLCRSLETLNASCNVLESFPKPPTSTPFGPESVGSSNSSTTPTTADDAEELDTLGEMGVRRLSQVSGGNTSNGSSANSARKGSITSNYAASSRKHSMLSRTSTDTQTTTGPRKDSSLLNKITNMFGGSLRQLYLADNRLSDDVFDQIALLQELRVLNLSYNELDDLPVRTCRKWQYLEELYLSGNNLTSLPTEDLGDMGNLRVLHINCNRFQVLPAELGKLSRLNVLDASSNSLKYNVYNWPYDWNWNSNPHLKYLSLSGNKRLEIRPPASYAVPRGNQPTTDFSSLTRLRVLGLMDVTLMISSVPDNTDDRRVRTSGSTIGSMGYGIADYLGTDDHISIMDVIVPKLEGHDDEVVFGLFDGLPHAHTGSKTVKFLVDNFEGTLRAELRKGKEFGATPTDALRRTYLSLNKDLATTALQPADKDRRGQSPVSQALTPDDLSHGAVATLMYLHGTDLYVSNVGDAQAMLIQSEGGHRFITQKHDPASPAERTRIREAGGYVSRHGKLNDELKVSRAFGFTSFMPSVIAAPYLSKLEISETDEIILLASRELWDILTPDFVVDLARSERADLMRAAQKLRDLAIAFGAKEKISIMMVGVSDLRRKERARYRSHSLSLGPSGLPDDYLATTARRGKRARDATLDSKLARLDQEVDAPVGEVSLVFTDIKSSTLLWEMYPTAMRSAIKMHNETMRRHLRLVGGYEVKTEGDAFMVAFPTVTSALLWAFTIQSQLLEVQWPQEIVSSLSGQEIKDSEGNVLFRGLSVRMGMHVGQPVCETDPVTRRMDYFGPMVNRAARISGVADGGQIAVSSDFIAEVQRLLETHIESDRSDSTASDDVNDDTYTANIKRELRSLSSQGFEVRDLGERRLKGLENPEYIYLMYPHSLSKRLIVSQQQAEAEKAAEAQATRLRESQLAIDLDSLWDLWSVSLRLEMLCSSLESSDAVDVKAAETGLLEKTRERGSEITDRFLLNFIEHQISRVETCTNTLMIRNMVKPFKNGMLEQACPMGEVFQELSAQLEELRVFKQQNDIDMAPS